MSFITLNILLLTGFCLSGILFYLNQKLALISYSTELKINYLLFLSALLFSPLQMIVPHSGFFEPPAKVWSAQSSSQFNQQYAKPALIVSVANNPPVSQSRTTSFWLLGFFLVFSLGGVWRLVRDSRTLAKIGRHSFLIRRIKKISIYSNDTISVPYSHWVPGRASVTLPSSMLNSSTDTKIAITHELQHHRQRDTIFLYLAWFVRTVCFFNPAVYFWNRLVSEIQELACDESMVGRPKVSAQVYASLLIRVAENNVHRERSLVGAAGLSFSIGRHSLTRRIRSMFKEKQKKLSTFTVALFALVMLAGMAGVASQSWVQDRRIDMKDAQKLLASVDDSQLPVVINDLVLKQLNRYVGTPEGRDYMRKSLSRMQEHQTLVQQKIREYRMPAEFLAVPIVESGYQNLVAKPKRAGGLWQFIVQTARIYGLTVNSEIDERNDIPKETDAAMRYLKANYLRFKSWELSLLAYNTGEESVQKGIEKTGSRNVWDLIRSGYENDKEYYPKVMAAILIMKNPTLLD